ncbi:MAG TPA: M36 family metallopeptidase [Tahibacter sp.]|uniref:M36 family metallopeptidase n=1 Tax=Tahibacter sp. TaxID=2056211 RepID=UPI002D010122|nr:M36 family metallopeptidase [Tahibacter sp.]HSX62571.1 M36 family metallopeptidase [Tahibacter sp.]
MAHDIFLSPRVARRGAGGDWFDGNGAENRLLRLAIRAMQRQPCEAGFIDARTASFAADIELPGGENAASSGEGSRGAVPACRPRRVRLRATPTAPARSTRRRTATVRSSRTAPKSERRRSVDATDRRAGLTVSARVLP